MSQKCLVLLVLTGGAVLSQITPNCDSAFGCLSYPTQISCSTPDEYWSPEANLGGCCPGCVRGLAVGAVCNEPNSAQGSLPCAPGLVCGHGNVCRLNVGDCLSTFHVPPDINWVPQCDNRGKYAPRQCRGDRLNGRCFCYSNTGERIFGWDWRNQEENMTCACSRRRAELEAEGRLDVTLHCTQNGNYEELQCDRGVCWCVNPHTGVQQTGTRAVPENSWRLLPCYNETVYGTQYLRRCESMIFSQVLQRKQFINRGQYGVTFTYTACDYDGSYGRYTIEGQEVFCMWRDGSKAVPYKTSLQKMAAMNCNCARDEKLFAAADRRPMELACEANGNYVPLQFRNGEQFCVDPNGFTAAENVTSEQTCDQFIFGAIVIEQ